MAAQARPKTPLVNTSPFTEKERDFIEQAFYGNDKLASVRAMRLLKGHCPVYGRIASHLWSCFKSTNRGPHYHKKDHASTARSRVIHAVFRLKDLLHTTDWVWGFKDLPEPVVYTWHQGSKSIEGHTAVLCIDIPDEGQINFTVATADRKCPTYTGDVIKRTSYKMGESILRYCLTLHEESRPVFPTIWEHLCEED